MHVHTYYKYIPQRQQTNRPHWPPGPFLGLLLFHRAAESDFDDVLLAAAALICIIRHAASQPLRRISMTAADVVVALRRAVAVDTFLFGIFFARVFIKRKQSERARPCRED